jgi:heme/copper-type cytochrome/quinol oxidase subunit 3
VTVTTTEHEDPQEDPQDDGRSIEAVAGHHESREQRHFKERLAVWLFIGGDLIFLLMELFFWFYLRALNTNGLWRGADCSKANPCTDGLGNPITSEIAKANPAYTLSIAGLTVIAALFVWRVEVASSRQDKRGVISGFAAVGLVFLLAAVVVQCVQFGKLPFTTIDGSYASTFIYFMGSTLGHLLLLSFLVFALWNRARKGKYDGGHWYQVRVNRIFATWIAISTCVLALVMVLFA